MGTFFCSGVIGLIVGVISTLWYLPRNGRRLRDSLMTALRRTQNTIQTRVDAVTPSDSVAESIAQGKAAARRRRDALGLDE